MSDPVRLEATVSELRKRMEEVGCVFEFTVQGKPTRVEASESDHRHALEGLMEFLRQNYERFRLNVIAREPSLATL